MSDLVTFGETMLRLSAPGAERLERTDQLEVHIGGTESNVAVAAARLGVDATWLSKLPDSPLGRRVTAPLHAQGVETEIVWDDAARQGLYFIEPAGEPRGTNVIYDRGDAAVTTATADELESDLVCDAERFFTTGITPALSPILEETAASLLELARESGTKTLFDINYRSKLWTPERARETLTGIFPSVDVLIVAERDAETVLGLAGAPADVAATLAEEYGFETAIVTRGAEGVLAYHRGSVHEQGSFRADTVDPIGTGDAFTGGFIAKRHAGGSVPEALEYGAATAALKRTMPGDIAVVTPDEVAGVIERGGREISR